MPLWIAITVAAAFMQNVRSALQKRLSTEMGTAAATYARFICAAPLALAYLWLLGPASGAPVPATNGGFYLNALAGGAAQILATAALIHSFTFRNFAAGTTYSKTEPALTALFSVMILGEGISLMAGLGIFISFLGVVALSSQKGAPNPLALVRSLGQPAALYGLASGALFGLSAVLYRNASLVLDGGDNLFLRAATTLAVVLVWQSVLMGGWLAVTAPGAFLALIKRWRSAVAIGVTGLLASIGWFTAVALYHAAYVRALGQVELLFTLLASVLFFREHVSARELAGMGLVVGGIVLLVLFP